MNTGSKLKKCSENITLFVFPTGGGRFTCVRSVTTNGRTETSVFHISM